MSELKSIIANSLDHSLTWCEHQYVEEPYICDWRIDPCLVVVIYPMDKLHRIYLRENGETKLFEGGNGDAFLIPAGVPHRFECPASEIIGVNIQYTIFEGVDFLSFYSVPNLIEAKHALPLQQSIDSLVNLIGQASWYAGENKQENDQLDLARIVKERQFAFELLSKVIDLSTIKPHGDKRLLLLKNLKPALEYIEDNLEQKISIDTLSRICKLSANRFSVTFKEIMGEPPHKYMLKRRIDKAMSLLSHTDLPVTNIAIQLGFHDQPHFTKLFQTVTGLSPTYYRKDIWRRFAKKDS